MLHALLCLSPALVLAIPLLARRYPGERALLSLGSHRPATWPRSRAGSQRRLRRPVFLTVARGGLLMGRALAERPPPALLVAS